MKNWKRSQRNQNSAVEDPRASYKLNNIQIVTNDALLRNYIRLKKSKFMSLQLHNNHITSVKEIPFVRFSPISFLLTYDFFSTRFRFLAISCAMSRCCCVDNDKHFLPLFCALRPEECYSGKEAGWEGKNVTRFLLARWPLKVSKPFPFPPALHGTLVTLKVKNWMSLSPIGV